MILLYRALLLITLYNIGGPYFGPYFAHSSPTPTALGAGKKGVPGLIHALWAMLE